MDTQGALGSYLIFMIKVLATSVSVHSRSSDSFCSLTPSPSGDESMIELTASFCVHLCFPCVSCVLHSNPCATCQPPGRSLTAQRPLGHTGET